MRADRSTSGPPATGGREPPATQKEVDMTIVKHRDELDWPAWELPSWFHRRWPEVADMWRDQLGGTIPIEEFDEDGTHVVRAEMPGIDPQRDVEITVTDHTLHLRAERRFESRSEEATGYHSEFRYGSFERIEQLPAGATVDDVTATYADGILELRIPVDIDAAGTKRIEVAHD
jgi:HSP20 family protein